MKFILRGKSASCLQSFSGKFALDSALVASVSRGYLRRHVWLHHNGLHARLHARLHHTRLHSRLHHAWLHTRLHQSSLRVGLHHAKLHARLHHRGLAHLPHPSGLLSIRPGFLLILLVNFVLLLFFPAVVQDLDLADAEQE